MEDNQTIKETPQKSGKKAVIIVSLVFIVIIAILAAVIIQLTKAEQPETIDGRGTLVTPDNVDEIRASLGETTPEGAYTTEMNSSWTFKTSTEPSENAYVKNHESNTHTVYFDVNLTDAALQEEGTLVYTSPYMPVGSELDEIALTEKLDPGNYDAVVTYHLVDENNNNEELSTVSVAVKLHILN